MNWIKTRRSLSREIEELKRKIINLDNEITLRERQVYFNEKMKLISEYEGRIIAESEKAAEDRELKMMEVVEAKERRIKELELENIDLRTGYRTFKDEVREHEIIIHDFNTAIQSALSVMKQLGGQFETYEYRMCQVTRRTDKKDTKMIEGGKA